MKVETCNHPACSCQVRDGAEFCCEGCETASKNVAKNDLCNCGHTACSADARS